VAQVQQVVVAQRRVEQKVRLVFLVAAASGANQPDPQKGEERWAARGELVG
jgi:hypothetical protein